MIKPYYEEPGIQIFLGDCLEIMPQLEPVDLVLTDPPYNINKAAWDKKDDYINWLVSVFKETERISNNNATLWFFHMVFSTLAQLQIKIEAETSYRHKQLIVIDKGIKSVAGRSSIETLRSFPRATEYLQFYTFEDRTGAEQLSEKYQRINPMAKYLKSEFDKAGVTNKEIAKLFPSKTGGLTGCVSNWLLGLNFPTKEQYEQMRKHLNYEYLRKEYEDLRKEYEDLRYSFNLPLGLTDVWSDISFYLGNNGHETPKPKTLMSRVIKTASKNNSTILDPFMGSGTTLVAAKELGRKCIGIEIEEKYVKIAIDRLRQGVFNFGGGL